MNILYVCTATSKKAYDNLFKITDGKLNHSIQNFHTKIIDGLSQNNNVTVLSGTQISNSNCKQKFFKSSTDIENHVKYLNTFFINIPIIKYITIIIFMVYNFFKWSFANKKNKIVFFDAAYVTINPIIVFLSNLLGLKKTCIVCDIYDYMSFKVEKNKKRNIVKKICCVLTNYVFKNCDSFVILTEQMNEIVNPTNKPYTVMEGLFDFDKVKKIINNYNINKKKKIVMYAGYLSEAYGVKKLVDEFSKIKNKNIELHLYGNGELLEYILKMEKKNKRIKYKGCRNFDELFILEQQAFLLVNPREGCNEYTKYSFPSKTMEYMSSATPVLCHRLDGIPDEYYNYIYEINDDGIASNIENILKKETSELEKIGKSAQKFILDNKNKKIQTQKISNLLKKTLQNNNDKEIVISKKFDLYLTFLITFFIFFSRNTLYATIFFNVKKAFMLLVILSIPLIYKYIMVYKNSRHSSKNLNMFLILITLMITSILIKRDFTMLNASIIISMTIAFLLSQLLTFRKMSKIYINIILYLSITSLFNLFVIKPYLVNNNLFSDLVKTSFLVRNNMGTPFINMITSFIIYNADYIRNFSIFTEPSYFQFYLITAIVISYFNLSKKIKYLYLTVFTLTLFSTFSTAGFIAFGVFFCLIIYDLYNSKKTNKKLLSFSLITFLILLIFLINKNQLLMYNITSALNKIFILNDSSSTRYNNLLVSLTTFLSHPLFGVKISDFLVNNKIVNTLPMFFCTYGVASGLIFTYYMQKFASKFNKNKFNIIIIFIVILLSSNSHIFVAVPSFWMIIFMCLCRKDNFDENTLDS